LDKGLAFSFLCPDYLFGLGLEFFELQGIQPTLLAALPSGGVPSPLFPSFRPAQGPTQIILNIKVADFYS
jgi:hypothetical protein